MVTTNHSILGHFFRLNIEEFALHRVCDCSWRQSKVPTRHLWLLETGHLHTHGVKFELDSYQKYKLLNTNDLKESPAQIKMKNSISKLGEFKNATKRRDYKKK